ncbi:glycoside hydrolase family 95 protein [Mucilaginibacter paludis]|uniref:Glycoside hydrolase family 2 sugar binding n=1 Tax=Mucilaginibacter paludis DSM 18603 TaxID=714943 RepID=H1YER5_9SPHI|nr:glycoside hydrolase family 95 protein [Mucilaginibacter paludis]EHQ30825.1 glycoside hydrolase family 2 sugar binding [Mucilaginibacter paludis DSM 18603]
MKHLLNRVIIVLLLLAAAQNVFSQDLKLWYKKPAEKWTDALPIGNGTLGAMFYGGISSDRIQFNEQTLWSGSPRKYQRDGAATYLPEIRNLLFAGKQAEAEALAEKHFMGKKNNEDTYPADSAAWVNKMRAINGPQQQSFQDVAWKIMKLPTEQGWEKAPGFEGLDGAVWFRTIFEVPADWKGKDLLLSLGRVRDIDFTYINGKQIGNTSGTAYRKYIIPAADLHTGTNVLAIQVFNFNDKGGLTSAAKELMIYPVGVQVSSVKGGITSGETISGVDEKGTVIKPIKLAGNWKYWIQDANPPAYPSYQADYLPFGDLILNFKTSSQVMDYKRDLDIGKAVATTTYNSNGVNFTREYLASDPAKAIIIHLKASKPGQINMVALLQTSHKISSVHQVDANTIALDVKVQKGVLKAVSYLYIKALSGTVKVINNQISISKADDVTIYLTAATSFKNYKDVSGKPDEICKQALQAAKTKTFAQLKAQSITDYQQYFNTFSVNLGPGKVDVPTDERIKTYSVAFDPGLLALYMQYGRYLLISCSRPNSKLPANLQGIWNDQMVPSWGSKFTTNINLQMNYWPAEELNLTPCEKPLFKMISQLAVTGAQTAKIHYDAPGWILHHNTDIWLGTAPINASNHGIWQGGAAWLCHQLWEHYLYTGDIDFLKKHYAEMKGAAEFFVSTLVKDPVTGFLISTPSNSPEHGGLVAGPTMDRQIIRDLFKNCISASEILKTDDAFRKTLQEKYAQIAPNKVGKFGQLQEWMEDKDDTADTHRHVSHLWGVYPGTDITWDSTPQMMKAAEKSFQYRGDEGTGWSLAWKVNLMARFKQGDHAMLLVNKLLSVAENGSAKERGGVYHNLFDAHPPFQIDGNFGGAAGIAEMLLQSQQGYIDLLPALPSSLPDGELKGICARGGFVLNMLWKGGKLQQVQVTSKIGRECVLKYGDMQTSFKTEAGKTYTVNGLLKTI